MCIHLRGCSEEAKDEKRKQETRKWEMLNHQYELINGLTVEERQAGCNKKMKANSSALPNRPWEPGDKASFLWVRVQGMSDKQIPDSC